MTSLEPMKIQGSNTSRYGVIPKFGLIQGSNVEATVEQLINDQEERLKVLESKADTISMRDLVDDLLLLSDEMEISWTAIKHISSVKSNDELRDAIDKAEPKITTFSLKLDQSKSLYNALVRVASDATDPADQRYIAKAILSRKMSGVGLEGAEASRFNEMELELEKLSTNFANNEVDAAKKWTHTVTDKNELKGIPPSYLDGFSETAKKNGHENASAADGPWVLGIDFNSYYPVIAFAENRELRATFLKAWLGRAGPLFEEKSNLPLVTQILKLKAEKAELLGYDNYAQVSCASDKMAKVEEVNSLLSDMRDRTYDVAKEEHATLGKYAQTNGFSGDLQDFDVSYWSEKMKQEQYGFDPEALRPYLKFDKVMEGLMELLEKLFKVTLKPMEVPEELLWDKEVRFYEILEDDKTISFLFVDPYARPGEKRSGAWMNEVSSRSSLDSDRIPTAHIVLNMPAPTETTPSLLKWRDMETIFHEMGHALQHMLTNTSHKGVSGIRNIEWDVVELPSQFMENWCFEYDVISTFASHYETGEVLPKDLFDKVKRADQYRAASFLLRQVRLGLADFTLHSVYDPRKSDKMPIDIWNEITARTSVLPLRDDDYTLCSFLHLFAGGYAAGYYSYLWAEVMSADAFAAFEETGFDENSVIDLGMKFRNTVLGMGGSVHPVEVYKQFRGKDATVDALLKKKGLLN